MDQVPELLRNPIMVSIGHEILSIENAYFLSILKWMHEEAERKCNTTKHPNVSLGVHLELHVPVDHFRRAIHHRRELLVLLHLLIQLLPCAIVWV